MHLAAKFHHFMFNRLEVIMLTNIKQRNRRRWKIHLASLCYAGG